MLEAQLGTPLELEAVRERPHRVVHARGPRGQLWCKCFGGGRAFRQSLLAHRIWGEALPPVLASDEVSRCLLMGHVDGTPARLDDPGVHEAAGRWLRRAHAGPLTPWGSPDPMPLVQAMERRARTWLEGASTWVSAVELGAARELLADLGAFEGEVRVPCHRDFGPHNWLVVPSGRLVVLDPEHARPDHWLADVVKLAADHWSETPELECAFSRGYGRPLEVEDRARLRVWTVGHALTMVVWGARHADPDLSMQGRRVLRRTLDGAL